MSTKIAKIPCKIIAIVFTILCLLPVNIYADKDVVGGTVDIPNDYVGIVQSIATAGNTAGAGGPILTVEKQESGSVLKFSTDSYQMLSYKQKQDFMKTALETTAKSQMGTAAKNKVYNFIANQDTSVSSALKYLQTDASADIASARLWLLPFRSAFSTILGILCILIFVFMAFTMVLDIFYISLPAFQGLMSMTTGDNKKPKFITEEAYSSVKEADSADHYVNALGLYLKRRLWVIILASIALAYLISGQLYDFLAWIMDTFQTIFHSFGS